MPEGICYSALERITEQIHTNAENSDKKTYDKRDGSGVGLLPKRKKKNNLFLFKKLSGKQDHALTGKLDFCYS